MIFMHLTENSQFLWEMTKSRRLFSWAGERRRRASELLFASPPGATRNGLAPPMRIGAWAASDEPDGNSGGRHWLQLSVLSPNEKSPGNPGRTLSGPSRPRPI